jgi:hypothetical protein
MARMSDGKKYLGDRKTMEVHDLDNETEDCQIYKTIETGHMIVFDTIEAAYRIGYSRCNWCMGGSDD